MKKRRKIRKSQTEAGLNCCINVLSRCDTVLNDGDSFSPESVLHTVSDESGNVLLAKAR